MLFKWAFLTVAVGRASRFSQKSFITLTAGLVIARLLDKDAPEQIKKLDDLRRITKFKILVKKNSFAEDLVMRSDSLKDLVPRIVLEKFDQENSELLQGPIQKYFFVILVN